MRITLFALLVAGVVTAIAWKLPHPSDATGAIALGVAAGLAVVVGWLLVGVREREKRLRRIEKLLQPPPDDE